jgi:pSer/pThr/pTyr-binding forkhead associated (FHA) protein
MEGADIMLSDPAVSRRHAEIHREGDEWSVVDLGSTNGTEVNGKRVNRHRLNAGDRIAFGESVLEFRRP